MAYTSRYPAKRRSKAGTKAHKKKPSGRVAKKGGSAGSTKLKTIIAGEVAKALNSGAQNERRKLTMCLELPQKSIFVNGKEAFNNCIRIPITDAIPAQAGAGQGPDVRRLRANKVVVTGVNVRASFSVADEMRVMMVVYEPHETVRKHLDLVPCSTEPSAAMGCVPEKIETTLKPYGHLGLVSKYGPLMTRKVGTAIELDSVDGSVFESRISTHGSKPIGPVFRKKFGGGDLYLDMVSCLTQPSAAMDCLPEAIETALVPYDHLGLVSKHGPLMTRKVGTAIELDSVDGSVFESRVSTHGGKPIGTAFRKKSGGDDLRRTVNWNQGSIKNVGLGYTAWSTHLVDEYWKLNKEFTYVYEGQNDQVFERSAEMFLYVDCPSKKVEAFPEDVPLVGAMIHNVIVDVYFHDK
ncbi:MAG: hypothetical protein LQ349_000615 [Xanthoria aureola]|nr:MAG: hypothetical protein LQ349_000615 [Xanthoria aureola]